MATFAEVQAEVARLQTALDAKQAEIEADEASDQQIITDLRADVARLQAIIDAGNGATPEQLQELLTSLTSTIADLESTTT